MASPSGLTGSYAVNQVDRLLGRVFSVTSPVVGLQMFVNAYSQSHLLKPIYFWVSVLLMLATFIGMIISVWVFDNGKPWYAALSLLTIATLATWEWQVLPGANLPENFQPWIWWAVGIAAISAFGAFRPSLAVAISFVLPVLFFAVHTRPLGGGADLFTASQDAALSFLFAGTISSLVLVLRYEASKVDRANERATSAAIVAATASAVEAERARVDALVHDSVLTTLLVAGQAATDADGEAAAQLASDAIERLESAQTERLAPDESISIASLFSALESSIKKGFEGIAIKVEGANDQKISSIVASALTGATLQALANSVSHAGNAVERTVSLKAVRSGIKIVVKDNGRGFRPSKVIKSRLGLKLSVIDRVESVGGRVFIDAKPGVGATIVIEWGRA